MVLTVLLFSAFTQLHYSKHSLVHKEHTVMHTQ